MNIQPKPTTQTKKKKSGFTLIEVIAVLVLLGILAAIALPKYIDLTNEAEQRALDAGIAELNGRESLAWGQQMLATSGAPVDATVFAAVDAENLGADYSWTATPTVGGGTLEFGSATAALARTTASETGPGVWTGN